MENMRKPFQGVWNIVRFNWHFYLIAFVIIISGSILNNLFSTHFQFTINLVLGLIILNLLTSLLVSAYIYDFSKLYKFEFLNEFNSNVKILNIHAGFDEASAIIQSKFPQSELTVYDFYDEQKHTEISIKRARKAYPIFQGTIKVQTEKIPAENSEFDLILNILSAHEIRNEKERIGFFREQNRVLKSNGKVTVTEHLRDLPNFLAYTFGFFHFHSKKTWKKAFAKAGFTIQKEIKTTPFISTFILTKNGTSS